MDFKDIIDCSCKST